MSALNHSASLIKQRVRGLLCGTGKNPIINYMSAWCGALHCLDGTPWDFMAFDCVGMFVDNLPMSNAYYSLREWVDDGFSAVPPLFPNFEDIATAALNINVQQHRLLALHPSNPSACRFVISAMPVTAPVLTSPTAPSSRPPCPVCTNCKVIGHAIKACWEPGGGNEGGHDKFYADNPHLRHPCANLTCDLSPPPLDTSPSLTTTPTVAHNPVPSSPIESNKSVTLYIVFKGRVMRLLINCNLTWLNCKLTWLQLRLSHLSKN